MFIVKEENPISTTTQPFLSDYIMQRISEEVERQIQKRFDMLSGRVTQNAVPKEKKTHFDVDQLIEGLSAKGHNVAYIQSYFFKNHALKLPESRIIPCHVGVLKDYQEWQLSQLNTLYPVLWIEYVTYQLEVNGVAVDQKIFYCFGVDSQGFKRVIAIAYGDEDRQAIENLLLDISARGVKDILIVCLPEANKYEQLVLKYFSDAMVMVNITFELNRVLELASSRDLPELRKDLVGVYQSANSEKALLQLRRLEKRWDSRYPLQCSVWNNLVKDLHYYWQLPEVIKTLACAKKKDQRINKKMKHIIKLSDNNITAEQWKIILFMCQKDITENRDGYRIYGWRSVLESLETTFPDRL